MLPIIEFNEYYESNFKILKKNTNFLNIEKERTW
jgi:hypothetical protein